MSRVRPKGGSHLMSRSLAERFERFKEVRQEGDDRSMDGLEELPPDQQSVRYKGSDTPEPNVRRQKPAYSKNN